MIEQLKTIFPSITVFDTNHVSIHADYQWFITSNKKIIGIHKNEITSKDEKILSTFLTPYHVDFPAPTRQERKWHTLIHSKEPVIDMTEERKKFRFVYFSMQPNQIDPISFKEAINELFANELAILWESNHEGIIIEEFSNQMQISYERIIDVLMDDLYVKISFFVGPFSDQLANVQKYYDTIIHAAQIAFKYDKKSVVTYIESVPYFLTEQLDTTLKEDISQVILQEYLEDEESVKMIETFIQCNLNMSETAKELYMHRNSLQYRLDRFQEKTGIDLRQFQQAISVYLAILAKRSS